MNKSKVAKKYRRGKKVKGHKGDGASANTSDSFSNPSTSDLNRLATKALHNHVIVENILRYLDYSSIKTLIGVSQRLKSIVRSNKQFLEATKVSFFKADGEGFLSTKQPPLKPSMFKHTDFPWRTVALQLDTRWKKKDLSALATLLRGVSALELHAGSYEQAPNWPPLLTSLLRTASQLTSLTIDADVLDNIPNENLKSFLESGEIQGVLKGLVSLSIQNSITSVEKYEILSGSSFGKNLSGLGLLPEALTRFGFERISYEEPYDDNGQQYGDNSENLEVNEALTSLLERHKSSLRYLTLDGFMWKVGSIPTTVFPQLTFLSLAANGTYLPRVSTFIANQPPLQYLELHFGGSTVSGAELLGPLKKHAAHLKRFGLTWRLKALQINEYDFIGNALAEAVGGPVHVARVRVDDDWDADSDDYNFEVALFRPVVGREDPPQPPPVVPPFSYNFLKDFVQLRELKVHQRSNVDSRSLEAYDRPQNDPRCSLAAILSATPDGIRTLDLRGTILGNLRGDSPQNTIESLSRFTHLSVLNLLQCPNAIDDEVMAHISAAMPQLLELAFSHSGALTDGGITGKPRGGPTHPGLRALTDLRKLKIVFCRELTRKGYLSALSFPSLRELTLVTTEGQLNKEFYEELAKQNPCLEILEISELESYSLSKLERALKRNSKRFRAVVFMMPLREAVPPSSEEELWGSDFTSDMDDDDFGFSHDDFGFTDGDDDEEDDDYDPYA